MMKLISRTANGGWHFEHHRNQFMPHEWMSVGGPSHDPKRHTIRYTMPESGKLDFRSRGWNEFDDVRELHGDDDANRMRGAILQHHNATEHDPDVEPFKEPEPPKPSTPKAPPKVYYHGTHVKGVTHILPANHHGHEGMYDETDRDYAYATPNLSDAWDYAVEAANHAKEKGHPETKPRVYATKPIGGHKHVEVDPDYHPVTGHWRGTNPDDKRSKKGFAVVKEMKASPRVRKDYPDEDWDKD